MCEKKNIKLTATVVEAKGECVCGHKLGDTFELSMMSSCGLCGGFYHDIFPVISTYQFGGTYPWFPDKDVFFSRCADPENEVVLKVVRSYEKE